MSLLNKLAFLFFLAGFYGPSNAAVEGVEFSACSGIFSAAEEGKGDKKDGGKKEEEEPDCE